MADFYWKQHDTAPAIAGQCTDDQGNAVDVTAATVTFIMLAKGGTTPKVNGTAMVTDGVNGMVSYTPIGADTDTAGDFTAEFQVIGTDSSKRTFPNPGYIAVTITADLDDA